MSKQDRVRVDIWEHPLTKIRNRLWKSLDEETGTRMSWGIRSSIRIHINAIIRPSRIKAIVQNNLES